MIEGKLAARNSFIVMLLQALCGAISQNFRLVALCTEEPVWRVVIVLERDLEEDREEIEDSVGDLDAMIFAPDTSSISFDVEVLIAPEGVPALRSDECISLYRRRESPGSESPGSGLAK